MVAGLVAAAVVVTAGVFSLWPRGAAPAAAAGLARLSITLPDGNLATLPLAPAAISPDGTSVVYVGTSGNKAQLFLRLLSESEVRPIPGTDNARSPFFSPNGEWIAFFAQGG
jgi:serine/threonine-protein kinase